MLLLASIGNAQIVNIPDANFKTALLTTLCASTDESTYHIADLNGDGEIQVSEALAVLWLDVHGQNIANLAGIEAFENLLSISCYSNQLTSLSLTNPQLNRLRCSNNQLTSLNISSLTQLQTLDCGGNNLTSLDITNFPILVMLWCNNNQLTEIDMSQNPLLVHHVMGSNLFTSLDFSATAPITDGEYAVYELEDNPNLTNVNFKSGITQSSYGIISIYNCPNLAFVCTGDVQLAYIQSQVIIGNPQPIVYNSYCSFTPGGQYNTISGRLAFDSDNNGCDASDTGMPNVSVHITDGSNAGANFSHQSGNYKFYTGAGTFTVEPQLELPSYFNVSPASATVNFPEANASLQTQNFCFTANGSHPDLEIILSPIGTARPGFDANYLLVYKNKGNQSVSGSANLSFDDAHADFVSAVPNVNAQAINNLSWIFTNLQPFETRTIIVKLNINSTVENPPVQAGDFLDFTATITPPSGDETPEDNVFSLHQHVVNALDPNDKTCLEGENVTVDNVGKYLHYNINFENTGTSDAVNVVVKDIIDTTKFDINSLQLLYASHPVETKITGNVVEFIFENINLPPSAINPIGGHGNVLFKIKTLPGLAIGTEVSNTAGIYFDYNAPIATNTARTTFAALGKTDFKKDDSITIYPNPVKNSVHITAKNNITNIQLFDIEGRILQTTIENKNTATLDISKQQSGIYFLKVETVDGSTIEKIIKE